MFSLNRKKLLLPTLSSMVLRKILGKRRRIRLDASVASVGSSSTPPFDFAGFGERVVRLSDPEMEPKMKALEDRIKNDPAYAQALLERAGIVDSKGNLTERFGG